MSSSPASLSPVAAVAIPTTFVLLWSTGFLSSRLAMPYAEPFTFLLIRHVCSAAVFIGIAMAVRAPWPRTWSAIRDAAIVGMLLQAVYLGGVFWAIKHGLSAGVAALIVGLQPLLTAAVVAPVLGERVSSRQWLGLAIGFVGVGLVVWEKIGLAGTAPITVVSVVLALLGITVGTVVQKMSGGETDLRTGAAIQFMAAAVVTAPMALWAEDLVVIWRAETITSMIWSVLVLSFGATSLLMLLIKRGAASKVASLFYLTPPVVAIAAWVVFDEQMEKTAMVGMGLTVLAVAMVMRSKPAD